MVAWETLVEKWESATGSDLPEQIKELAALKESGCSFLLARQSADEVLFVPAGWLMCSKTTSGPLTYGCRKCWAIATESQHASYETLHGLFAHSGKNTSKMQEVLKILAVPDSDA